MPQKLNIKLAQRVNHPRSVWISHCSLWFSPVDYQQGIHRPSYGVMWSACKEAAEYNLISDIYEAGHNLTLTLSYFTQTGATYDENT